MERAGRTGWAPIQRQYRLTGVAASLKLKREGIDWSHRLTARADYQRLNGKTSREQFNVAYEPRWQFDEDMFVYGLAQYERDRI